MIRYFQITAQIVGPYLPKDNMQIGEFKIVKAEKISTTIASPPGIETDAKTSLASISCAVSIDSPYVVVWKTSATSSKTAYEQANTDLSKLLTCISLPTPGYKYVGKIAKVEYINIAEGDHDPESAPSEALHVISYEYQEPPKAQTLVAEAILALDGKEVTTVLQLFKRGIDAEVYGIGDAQLHFFQVLEQVSFYTIKRSEDSVLESAPDYASVLNEIRATIESDSSDKNKAKEIKQYAQKLRALDFEQIGERIKKVAATFNLTPEVISKIDKITRYRAKAVAHANVSRDVKILDDPRDTREVARIFALSYFSTFHSVEVAKLWEFGAVKERNDWYRFTYARSDQGM